MAFDEEPERRCLLWHAENERLFEDFHLGRTDECLDNGCTDVTNIPEWEERFKAQKERREVFF